MNAALSAQLLAQSQAIIPKLQEIENDNNWAANGHNLCDLFKIEIGDRLASKGVATINYPIEKVIDFLNQNDSLGKLNDALVNFAILHEQPEFKVLTMEYKATWPVSNRDFVSLSVRKQEGDTYYIATQSCDFPYPEKNGVVRAHLHVGGYILRKINENSTSLTYISDTDIKGNVPGMIKNAQSAKQGQVAGRVNEAMQKSGF